MRAELFSDAGDNFNGSRRAERRSELLVPRLPAELALIDEGVQEHVVAFLLVNEEAPVNLGENGLGHKFDGRTSMNSSLHSLVTLERPDLLVCSSGVMRCSPVHALR
jgi:hypothetical protein